MGLEEIVALFVNNGVGVACIVYFMFRDYHFMSKLTETLSALTTSLDSLKKITERMEQCEKGEHNEP